MAIENSFLYITATDSEKIVNINKENVKGMQDCQWTEFIECIKEVSKIEKSNDASTLKKIKASKEVLNYMEQCLDFQVNRLHNSEPDPLKVSTEILRFLRNCTSDLVTQHYILERTNILNTVDFLFCRLIEVDVNNICLKILVQFLINLISSNKEAGEKISAIFYDRVKKCLQSNINLYECSALIYYMSLTTYINDIELINVVLNLLRINSENEFLIFFLENNILNSHFWSIYKNFEIQNRIIVMETLRNMQLQKKICSLPLSAVDILAQEFLNSAGSIFTLAEKDESKLKAYEVSLLLEILSSLSSDENHLLKLQSNKDILVNTGVLLINIHKLGKESNNCFTPIQKLTEFKVNSELGEHPAFGFKADLVRLIGNLCWKNTEMQNLARTAELISVILDCCNMDARNPFIIQWSVLAVRNLCENNKENQKVIAGLHREGAVSSEVLSEMGITLHNDGENELKMISLESLKKN